MSAQLKPEIINRLASIDSQIRELEKFLPYADGPMYSLDCNKIDKLKAERDSYGRHIQR